MNRSLIIALIICIIVFIVVIVIGVALTQKSSQGVATVHPPVGYAAIFYWKGGKHTNVRAGYVYKAQEVESVVIRNNHMLIFSTKDGDIQTRTMNNSDPKASQVVTYDKYKFPPNITHIIVIPY